jgi:NAD(P)-dependent dehydrogenase (short-subunit alcohol dehydrogenase family)
MNVSKAVLITGCSSGIGWATAERRHVTELLGVDDEPDGPDAPIVHLEAHDALGNAVPEVADEARPSVDACSPYGEAGRDVAQLLR